MARRRILIVSAFLFAVASLAPYSQAALVFAINNAEGNPATTFNLNDGSSTATLTVGVRRDDFDSGGDRLASFGFTLRVGNPSVAQVTGVSINNPGNVSNQQTTLSGGNGSAKGDYNTRPVVFSSTPGVVPLATFTLTGVGSGSTSVFIDELTVGNNDFITSGETGPGTGQDRTGFSGDGTVIGTASTTGGVNSSVTAVPEPASCVLVGGCLLGAFAARRRRRVSAHV